ncbi:hypothetical protein PENSPDRAFT_749863 [Peniophora sp. CONT]|nr:hypothetical protein PENSPDRAFT_749863 [Peniophora sp. CONT]
MSSWCWFNPAILSRAESIQYREAASPDDDNLSQWQLLFQHTTPLLKSLDLELSIELDDRIIDSEMFRPPPNQPHTLTRLRLIDCFLLPNSPLLSSSLTHLILESSEPSSQFAFPDLTLLPNLRELRLLDIFSAAQYEASEIKLPSCFKLLQLECQTHTKITSCFNLVARLKLPPDSTATLVAIYPSDDSSVIDTMKEALKGFFNDSRRPVSELRIFESVIDTLRGQRTQTEWTLYPPEMGEALAVDRMHGARHTFCVEPKTTAVLSCISLTHLKSVCLSDWSLETTDGVFDAVLFELQYATQLNRLSLQSPWQCGKLLQMLGEVDDSHTADPVHAPIALFPQLEELILHDQGTFPVDERNRHIMISCSATAVLVFLGRRARHGAPLRKLLVAESLKDWDAWSLVEKPTAVTFFEHAIESLWDPSI